MILVDTSVWIDHLRASNPVLVRFLGEGRVLTHPFVISELALGDLRDPLPVLDALREMPQAVRATDDEVLAFTIAKALNGLRLSHVDAHLLVSARLSPGVLLWTLDPVLALVAERFGLRVEPVA